MFHKENPDNLLGYRGFYLNGAGEETRTLESSNHLRVYIK